MLSFSLRGLTLQALFASVPCLVMVQASFLYNLNSFPNIQCTDSLVFSAIDYLKCNLE